MLKKLLLNTSTVSVSKYSKITSSINSNLRGFSSSDAGGDGSSSTTFVPPSNVVNNVIDSDKHVSALHKQTLTTALKPKQLVEELDKYIIGQADAKRAVAIALRNRWRRHLLSDELRNEVIPKNILMIGPTGCGKTEIARRIAKLSQAPFLKVEATKFTEVGFHGKDVDQIIRDLVDISINMTRKRIKDEQKAKVAAMVNERILISLVGPGADRESLLNLLNDKQLEDREVEVEVPPRSSEKAGVDMAGGTQIFMELVGKMGKVNGKKNLEKRRMSVREARPLLEDQIGEQLLEEYDVVKEAVAAVEESGIVFIDEIDKLVTSGEYRGADASSEGVQRDLLPLIEGCTISTKHGNVNTDFILFICSGAFHSTKPSDLLAELQGRLPIRVQLKGLTEDDLYRILTEPVTNLLRQQKEMLKTENVTLSFTEKAVREIAKVAHETNRTIENIGARRLHTVIERIVEEISFDAPSREGEEIEIDEEFVKLRVAELMAKSDLRKYIL